MKPIRYTLTLLILTFSLFTSESFALFDVGADGSYSAITTTTAGVSATTGAITSNTQTFTGAVFTPYAHFNFSIPALATIGIGPYIGFSSMKAGSLRDLATEEKVSFTRYGVDAMVILDVVPIIQPYARFGLGKDSIEWSETSKSANGVNTFVANAKFGGLQYQILVGGLYKVSGPISIFAHFGVTGGTNSTVTLTSYTTNGVAQPIPQPNLGDGRHIGYLIGAGVHFSL